MATKGRELEDSKKRKRPAGKESGSKKLDLKKPKFTKNATEKISKKPFKPQNKVDGSFKKSHGKSGGFVKEEKVVPKTKQEQRVQAKELIEARKKKRKRNYTLEQELTHLWEKMRQRNISKEDRSKFVSEAIRKMKGKVNDIATSPVTSRVLQTCIKYGSQAERGSVFAELRPHFLILSRNKYAVHMVNKMLDNASKEQLVEFNSFLHGHVASLLRHVVGSMVVERAYSLGNAAQKQALVMELYSVELKLFKDLVSMKESRLEDVIAKLGLRKGSVLEHMKSVIQAVLGKNIVDHSIIHRALLEYLSIADKASAADVIQQLSGPSLVRMIHTKDGARIGMLCVKHGSAKERKNIIKGLTEVSKIAHDQYGSLVLVCILSTVDDTKLVSKNVVRELKKILKELVFDKNGRRPLLQLLHPNCSRYLSVDDLAAMELTIPSLFNKAEASEVEETGEDENMDEEDADADESSITKKSKKLVSGGKKDPFLRRKELLVDSGLAESLIDTCVENAEELLRSNLGKEIIYEVAIGGTDGILHPALDEKLEILHEAITSLVAKAKPEAEEGTKEEHILEQFHSSRTIRKLVLDSPSFASTLWNKALKGKSEIWAKGHSGKVFAAFLESSNAAVNKLARKELQPLIDSGVLVLTENKHPAAATKAS
ncbi:pumilio homolog 24 isoform X2 [Impatiens glandulifera]|uniref:pumilio homolog 24 isoform X2 n=1 Tax=Impatiens glandulifera TaxID=253017 RepID=UPI001FB18854|nr:pumilio homolog 24 isoform X2 [Impatiens glandulifera]